MANRNEHDRDGNQAGPQEHAEGQHGSKTHDRFVEQLHSRPADEPRGARANLAQQAGVASDGKHPLVEDREQHDEAELNSERERLTEMRDEGKDIGDNRHNLHGLPGHKGHRADYKTRGPDGLPIDK